MSSMIFKVAGREEKAEGSHRMPLKVSPEIGLYHFCPHCFCYTQSRDPNIKKARKFHFPEHLVIGTAVSISQPV